MERWVRCFDYDEPYKLIVDDDLMPHPSLVKKMYSKQLPIVGVYGKSGVESANSYQQLTDHWNEDAKVDFIVGAITLVKQSALSLLRKDIDKKVSSAKLSTKFRPKLYKLFNYWK